jgi:hypothetical protein
MKFICLYFRRVFISEVIPDSAVGIATGYGLDGRGVGVRVPVGSRIFSSLVVQTGTEAQSTSCPMVTSELFPWG